MLEVFSDFLKSEGYIVNCAGSGREGILRMSSNSYDIVFLDMLMPELNGVQTFQMIKSNGYNTTVVMMTAYAYSELIDQAKMIGVSLIILKPFDFYHIGRFLKEFSASSGLNQNTLIQLRQALDYRIA
jgi:CheY-like chemotaxis protein